MRNFIPTKKNKYFSKTNFFSKQIYEQTDY